jgi:hypothetical protein
VAIQWQNARLPFLNPLERLKISQIGSAGIKIKQHDQIE